MNDLMPTDIETLNALAPGWVESHAGGMLCNGHPKGGIIDHEIVSGNWFVIFNDKREIIDGLDSRHAAVQAFVSAPAVSEDLAPGC